jgi:hypothetical protein
MRMVTLLIDHAGAWMHESAGADRGRTVRRPIHVTHNTKFIIGKVGSKLKLKIAQVEFTCGLQFTQFPTISCCMYSLNDKKISIFFPSIYACTYAVLWPKWVSKKCSALCALRLCPHFQSHMAQHRPWSTLFLRDNAVILRSVYCFTAQCTALGTHDLYRDRIGTSSNLPRTVCNLIKNARLRVSMGRVRVSIRLRLGMNWCGAMQCARKTLYGPGIYGPMQ